MDTPAAFSALDTVIPLLQSLILLSRQLSAVLLLPRDHAGHVARFHLIEQMSEVVREVEELLGDLGPQVGLLQPHPPSPNSERAPKRR
jgi:hypothetical protein